MYKSLYIILMFFGINLAYSQNDPDYFDSYRVTVPNKDTLLYERLKGVWYVGVTGGPQYDLYYNDLKISKYRGFFDQEFSEDYSFGYGEGYNVGLYGEWRPPTSKWGCILSLSIPDRIKSVSYTPIIEDSLFTKWRSQFSGIYLTISPAAKYRDFPWKNFFVTGGIDLGIPITTKLVHRKIFINSGIIDFDKNIDIQDVNIRATLNLGLGYEFRAFSLFQTSSVYVSPYVQLRTSTSSLSDNNSSWYSSQVRAGITFKWSKDRRNVEVLPYNPNYVENPKAINIMPKNIHRNLQWKKEVLFAALSLDTVERISVQEKAKPEIPVMAQVVNKPAPPEEQKPKIKANEIAKVKYVDGFLTNKELISKLDAFVEYMKKNPYSELRVESHSEDIGTEKQNFDRAQRQLKQVVKYLTSKGISKGRILTWNRSDYFPLVKGGSKTAPANRRVEMTIIQ